jgi:hypothetical protein
MDKSPTNETSALRRRNSTLAPEFKPQFCPIERRGGDRERKEGFEERRVCSLTCEDLARR